MNEASTSNPSAAPKIEPALRPTASRAVGAASVPIPVAPKGFSLRGRMLPAIGGTVALGLALPILMLWWHFRGTAAAFVRGGPPEEWNIHAFFFLLGHAASVGSWIAAAFSIVLLRTLRRYTEVNRFGEDPVIIIGAGAGMLASLLGMPSYFAIRFPAPSALDEVRFLFLLLATGATCGAWIGWQAYRERWRARGPLPRFSLLSLIVLTLCWGALVGLYAPEN